LEESTSGKKGGGRALPGCTGVCFAGFAWIAKGRLPAISAPTPTHSFKTYLKTSFPEPIRAIASPEQAIMPCGLLEGGDKKWRMTTVVVNVDGRKSLWG
jgi:hypothetical protein